MDVEDDVLWPHRTPCNPSYAPHKRGASDFRPDESVVRKGGVAILERTNVGCFAPARGRDDQRRQSQDSGRGS